MVSDSDLVSRLQEILQSSDLDTATPGSVRRQLEKDFAVDLSDRKAFIRQQIDIFFESLQQQPECNEEEQENAQENENDAVEEEEEEEEIKEENERSNTVVKPVKKRGGICSLSPQLQEVVGVPELARTEVVSKLWVYIRKHDLQDPKNRRNIKCDEALKALFRVESINMFQMNKVLSKHIWPLTARDENVELKAVGESSNESLPETDITREEKEEQEEDSKDNDEDEEVEAAPKKVSSRRKKKEMCTEVVKEVKKRGGGFAKICNLSDQLQKIVGAPQLGRTEVVKKLWEHIREHNLQDPKDRRVILCDDSLRNVFNMDSINMFRMNKELSKHIWPLDEEAGPDNSSQKEKQLKHGREEGSDEPKQKEKQRKNDLQ